MNPPELLSCLGAHRYQGAWAHAGTASPGRENNGCQQTYRCSQCSFHGYYTCPYSCSYSPWYGGPYTYLWLDALTQKVREAGRIVNVCVVVATAVNLEGQREVLGIDVGTSALSAIGVAACPVYQIRASGSY